MSIVVKPISAQLVKDFDKVGKQDPYCLITVGSQSFKTSTHKEGGKHPLWDDVLTFSYTE